MKKLKVIKITDDTLVFDNEIRLTSYHEKDWCENHSLDMSTLQINDFDGLEFDLSGDNFFRKIEGYGVELVPLRGWPVKIPGYGYNNGYYSTNLWLVIENENHEEIKRFDIEECQSGGEGI